MPEEADKQAVWLLQKLTLALQNAKMWPVKLAGANHQAARMATRSALRYGNGAINILSIYNQVLSDRWAGP